MSFFIALMRSAQLFCCSIIYHNPVTVIIYKLDKCRNIVTFENEAIIYRAWCVTQSYLVLLSVKLPHLYFEKCEKKIVGLSNGFLRNDAVYWYQTKK